MTDAERRVAELIRQAFRGVKLGGGVGLLQAQGLDDYSDAETLAKYRSQDEKEDWSRLSFEELNSCESSIMFFDAEGMQFHLPAYLLADLEGTLNQSVLFQLCYHGNDTESRFALFNEGQRSVVREFLLLRLADPDCQFEHPMIENALEAYWNALS